MEEVTLKKRVRRALTVEQKVAFVLLVFLGFGGIILGFLSFGTNIRRPFDIQIANYTGERFLSGSQKDAEEEKAQKGRDSDSDGINDYDELFVFKTSPYIADTDSDGIDDKTEIYGGTDPNCPKGKKCFNTTDTSVFEGNNIKTTQSNFEPFGKEDKLLLEQLVKSVDPMEIRQELLRRGLTSEDLVDVSDSDLQQLLIKNARLIIQ